MLEEQEENVAEEQKEIINIEDFFTEEHEAEGVWFEPKIKGVSCGFKFLVTGVGTDENVAGSERYEKKLAELNELKDPIEKANKKKILEANRVTEFIKGFCAADGKQLMYKGKPLEYSVPFMQQLLLKSPLLREKIIEFAIDTTNFIVRKKNA